MRTSEQTAKETLPIIFTAATSALLLVMIIFLILSVSGISAGTAAETEGQSSAGWLDTIAMRNAAPPESVAVEYLTGLDRGPGGEPFTVVRGCSSTSRMLLTPVRYITILSKPRP